MASGTDKIAAAFAAADGRAALMPYLMGGFPDLGATVAIGAACADNGADLLELGVPFSDPLADGPVIHAAGTRALAAGTTLHGVLGAAAQIVERIPVVLMCYTNLVIARGPERFADELAQAGLSGLIVPDLPLGEDAAVREACDAAGLALVPLVAPTTPYDRMSEIARRARGFLYTVSAGLRARARKARLPGAGRRRLRHLVARAGRRGGRRRGRGRDRRIVARARRRRGRRSGRCGRSAGRGAGICAPSLVRCTRLRAAWGSCSH